MYLRFQYYQKTGIHVIRLHVARIVYAERCKDKQFVRV